MVLLILMVLFLCSPVLADDNKPQISINSESFSAIGPENNLKIIVDMRYFTTENFTLEKIDGYKANLCFLHTQVMKNLEKVQKDLLKKGYGLYLFDCYRPQKGVNHFVRWSEAPDQPSSKKTYYPNLEKSTLFNSGYIARRSGHSRGSTVDLSIYKIGSKEKTPIDMGTPFDFFSPKSHTANSSISERAKINRNILKSSMEKFGFENYRKEWWHYTFKPEPTPKTYFNFNVSPKSIR